MKDKAKTLTISEDAVESRPPDGTRPFGAIVQSRGYTQDDLPSTSPSISSTKTLDKQIIRPPSPDLESASIQDSEAEKHPTTSLLTGKRLYLALTGLDALLFIASLDLTIIATVYIEIANSFESLSRAEWTVTAYMLSVTALQPLYGKLSDILGRVETTAIAVSLFIVGSIMCALSKSMTMLIASRAVQGMGGGGLISLIFVIAADILSERERGKYIGVFTGTWGVASAIAPVLGGAIVQRSTWRLIFWIKVPICVCALALVVVVLRLPRPKGTFSAKLRKIDFAGSGVFLAGALPFLLALSWGGREYAWSSGVVLGCLVSGLVVIVAFFWFEWRFAHEPIIPSRLIAVRNVALSAVGHFLYGAAGYGPIVFVPQWAITVRGASAIAAGMHLLPFTIGTIITSVIGGLVMTRSGRYRRVIIAGSVLLAVGNGLMVLFGKDTSRVMQIGVLLLSGLGAGASIQPIMMAAQVAVSGRDMAAVTTLCAFLRSLGAIICVSILSSIVHSEVKTGLTDVAKTHPFYIGMILRVGENQSIINSPEMPEELRLLIVGVFERALRLAFVALLPFSVILVFVTLGFEHIEMNTRRKQTIQCD